MSGLSSDCKFPGANLDLQSILERIIDMSVKLDIMDQAIKRIDIATRDTLAKASEKISNQAKEIDRLTALLSQLSQGDEQQQAIVDNMALALNRVSDGVVEFGKGL